MILYHFLCQIFQTEVWNISFSVFISLYYTQQHVNNIKAFNIFQVYQYFTINRRYFLLKFEQFHDYFIQYSLKSGGTKDHFRQVKIPPLIERSAINCKVTDESKGWPRLQAEFLFSLKSFFLFSIDTLCDEIFKRKFDVVFYS